MHHLFSCLRRGGLVSKPFTQCQALVRFFALRRIKPHTPPLVRAPVNSFEWEGSIPPTPSIHRLRPGLPGYLIPFAPLAFGPQRQPRSRKPPSPLVFFLISTHFTATPGIPLPSPALKRHGFLPITGLSPELSGRTCVPACAPFTPNDSGQRLPPTYYRGCWHVVSRGFLAGYRPCPGPPGPLFPGNRALRPEGLLHSRGVAPSGFRPLRKIPHCCLP